MSSDGSLLYAERPSSSPPRQPVSPIRVMIADDEETVREALVSLMAVDDDIAVVGAGGDADQAIAIAAAERPDVALLDVRMPRGGGLRAAREITRVSPGTELIALSANDDPNAISAMIRAGAGAYLVKGAVGIEIVDVIHRSAQGPQVGAHRATPIPGSAGMSPAGSRERLRRIEAVVRGDGVDVVYQPIFDLGSGRPVGAEALCRFGVAPLRSPDAWFAEADDVGLRIDLETAVARLALHGLDRLDPSLRLDINVSPETCCSPELRRLLETAPAERVVLEITEHALVEDYGPLAAALVPLRERGVGLAIDDTCSGLASLRHVLCLEPDTIKLDVTLTRRIERDRARRSLVEAIVGFAPSIGAQVLAGGIGSAEQMAALLQTGVQLGQGGFLELPGPVPRSGTWPALFGRECERGESNRRSLVGGGES